MGWNTPLYIKVVLIPLPAPFQAPAFISTFEPLPASFREWLRQAGNYPQQEQEQEQE